MKKIQQLELMDKVQRELQELENSHNSLLKKVSQIEAQNLTLGIELLQDKQPDLHEEISSSVNIVVDVARAFVDYRENFVFANKHALQQEQSSL